MDNETTPESVHEDRSIVQLVEQDASDKFWLASSLPKTDGHHRMMLLSIWESDCDKGEAWIGREFLISDFIAGPCKVLVEDTGELLDELRTLMLGPDHPPIAFVARSATEGLMKLAYAFGRQPPWEPPIRVKLRQARGRGANRVYKFIPIWENK